MMELNFGTETFGMQEIDEQKRDKTKRPRCNI